MIVFLKPLSKQFRINDTYGTCPFQFPKKSLEMHAVTKTAKIRQNHEIRQADFALTNLTTIRQNRQIHEQPLGLTKFR